MSEATPVDWEEVARRYGRKIYNFAYRLTGNSDDAHDLVQEVLLRVRRGLPSYTPGSFEGWLWRITRNAFLDEIRRRRRRPSTALPDDLSTWTSVRHRLPKTRWRRYGSGKRFRRLCSTFPTTSGKPS